MKIDCLELGDFQTNCYILRADTNASECLLIDPGFDPEPLLAFLRDEALKPQRILLTHGHSDHIAGIAELQQAFGPIPVGIGKEDAPMLTSALRNLSIMIGASVKLPPADELYEQGDVIAFAGWELNVLATPGHTPGGVSFYAPTEGVVFTGDALFAGSVGRTDFPGGSQEVLVRNIRQGLLTLPDATVVYSGHGPETTIAREKRSNPYLK